MKKEPGILFVFPAENDQARSLTMSLKQSLPEWNIHVTDARLTTLLFEVRRFELAHFFFPATGPSAQLIRKMSGKTRLMQTILSAPEKTEDYGKFLFGDPVICFSEEQKAMIRKHAPEREVLVIPPGVALPDSASLMPSHEVRKKYGAHDRMLVVALTGLSNKQNHDTFLYIAREYHRKEGFRLFIPARKNGKNSQLWRERLQSTLETEKLTSTTLLDDGVDLLSLLDSADIAIYPDKTADPQLELPLLFLTALCMGKPVVAFNVPAIRNVLSEFQPQWICNNTEDFVRLSRDLARESTRLEETSTELARFARGRYSVEEVSNHYRDIYSRLFMPAARG